MSTEAIHYETLSGFTPLSTLGPYRAADYWKLPEDERVELIRGRLIEFPSRNVRHQTVVGAIAVHLLKISRVSGGIALPGPIDVFLDDHTFFQPDIVYIQRSRRAIVKDRLEGLPDLVVEIISEGHARRDRVDKLNLYAKYGVAEYWIVDPSERQFDFLVNRGGRFEVQPQQDNRYASPTCTELEIDLAAFWKSVDEQVGTSESSE